MTVIFVAQVRDKEPSISYELDAYLRPIVAQESNARCFSNVRGRHMHHACHYLSQTVSSCGLLEISKHAKTSCYESMEGGMMRHAPLL